MEPTQPVEWEYLVERPARDGTKKEVIDPTSRLNELGAARWELAETLTYEGGGTKFLVFKRPRHVGQAE